VLLEVDAERFQYSSVWSWTKRRGGEPEGQEGLEERQDGEGGYALVIPKRVVSSTVILSVVFMNIKGLRDG
jgi:hypothetical protein